MALEYKMISPASETDEEKLERLTNELISMEEHYKLLERLITTGKTTRYRIILFI